MLNSFLDVNCKANQVITGLQIIHPQVSPGVEQRAKGQKRSHISFRLEVFPSIYKSVCNSDQVAHEINVQNSLLLH
jgi:hypothetical protein